MSLHVHHSQEQNSSPELAAITELSSEEKSESQRALERAVRRLLMFFFLLK